MRFSLFPQAGAHTQSHKHTHTHAYVSTDPVVGLWMREETSVFNEGLGSKREPLMTASILLCLLLHLNPALN